MDIGALYKKNTAINKQENHVAEKDRLTYIDIAKGVGISMIVLAHAHCIGGNYFIAFAVPLFFIISGFLYNKELSLLEYSRRKIVTLYLPFILCNLIWPIFVLCSRAHAGYPITNNLIYIFNILLMLKKDGFLFGATWFLGSLFFASISYKIVDVFLKKLKYKNYFIVLIYILLAYVTCQFMSFLSTGTKRTLIMPLFFAIGVFIKSNICYIRKINNKFIIIPSFLFFIIFEIYLTKIGMIGYSYNANSINNLIAFVINALFSAYIIIYLSKIADNNINNKICKLFSYLGRNSLYILLWQFVFFEMLNALFLRVNNIPLFLIDRFPHAIKTDGIWWLVYFLIGVFGPILLAECFKGCKKKLKLIFLSEPFSKNVDKLRPLT